jgi:hypothetical protein
MAVRSLVEALAPDGPLHERPPRATLRCAQVGHPGQWGHLRSKYERVMRLDTPPPEPFPQGREPRRGDRSQRPIWDERLAEAPRGLLCGRQRRDRSVRPGSRTLWRWSRTLVLEHQVGERDAGV